MENRQLKKVEPLKYWPHDKNIPVLSESSIAKLKEARILETGKDPWKEDFLNINIDGANLKIPKMLTSRAALLFLGFEVAQAEKLWKMLLNVSSPLVIPNVENGGQWAFWMEVKLWICDEIFEAPGHVQKDKEAFWTKKLLDRVGITQACREQNFKVIKDGKVVTTNLKNQKPQDVLYLVKKYIDHRWQILAKMESVIAQGDHSEWWPRLRKETTKNPMDFQAVYKSVDTPDDKPDESKGLSDMRDLLPTKVPSGLTQW